MKVSEYLNKEGLKNYVDESFEDPNYKKGRLINKGVHKILFFIRLNGDKIEDIKYFSSKRCKKLLAIAEYVAKSYKGKKQKDLKSLDFKEIEKFFSEEKEIEKMKDRFSLIKEALKTF